MSKTLKSILITAVIVGAIILVVLNPDFVGQVFAALAGGFAAFRAKIFNSSRINVEEETAAVEQEHLMKRKEWQSIKDEYDSKFNAIKARMDYLDYKATKLTDQIGDLSEEEKKALAINKNMSNEELLDWLKNN